MSYQNDHSLGHADFDPAEALDNDIVPVVADDHHRVDRSGS